VDSAEHACEVRGSQPCRTVFTREDVVHGLWTADWQREAADRRRLMTHAQLP
jgi:hypothetical protein